MCTGIYEGVEGQWLRWYDTAGNWVASKQERILNAEQLITQERQRADLLAAKLQALGIDVDGML